MLGEAAPVVGRRVEMAYASIERMANEVDGAAVVDGGEKIAERRATQAQLRFHASMVVFDFPREQPSCPARSQSRARHLSRRHHE